ncbi:MAG TPA: tetratricopeptide repeat protein [Thermoanaerobaculia bacterium]
MLAFIATLFVAPGSFAVVTKSADCASLAARAEAIPPASGAENYRATLAAWEAAYPVCQSEKPGSPVRVRSAMQWSDILAARGDRAAAEKVLRTEITAIEKTGVRNDVVSIDLYRQLGSLLGTMERHVEALQWLKAALQLEQTAHGATTVEAAEIVMMIGYAHELRNDLAAAENTYREAIRIARKACAPPCATLATAYTFLFNLIKTQPGRETEASALDELVMNAVP